VRNTRGHILHSRSKKYVQGRGFEAILKKVKRSATLTVNETQLGLAASYTRSEDENLKENGKWKRTGNCLSQKDEQAFRTGENRLFESPT
jgi:hypothetical protein